MAYTFTAKPLGRRREIFGDDEYDAFKLEQAPAYGNTWPGGPLFPEGHVYVDADGTALEIVASRTRHVSRSAVHGDVMYVHEYLCRLIQADEAGADW